MAEAGARPHADVRIAGDGFLLRAWRQEDLAALLRHADDPQVPRGLSDRFPHPYTRADGEAFLAGRVVDFAHPVFAIDIDGDNLTIKAERRNEHEEKDKSYVRCERSYGSYARSFDISGIKAEDIKASYNDGVLSLTMPKKDVEVSGSRRLAIE